MRHGLKRVVDQYVLGTLLSDDLPAIAVQALVDGYDSPSLRQLAGAQGDDPRDVWALFSKALAELGVSTPLPAEAGLTTARSIAEEVLDGNLTPYQGAKRIWGEIYTRFPELVQLRSFVGLASEYEDNEKHRESYSFEIVQECRALLGR